MHYHLAQINIAELKGLKGDPVVQGFYDALAEINAIADQAPGFIWRYQTPAGDATEVRAFEIETILVNISVWESVDALYNFTYYSNHASVYRRRAEWTTRMTTMHMALWYIPAGTLPTIEDGKTALERVNQQGSSPLAFTFKKRYTIEEFLALNQVSG